MKRLAFLTAAAIGLGAPLAMAAPAIAAPVTLTITYNPSPLDPGNATTTGAQFELVGPITNGVNVGAQVSASVAVDGAAAGNTYVASWYACPARGSATADCQKVHGTLALGAGADLIFRYTVEQETLGKYLRLGVVAKDVAGAEVGTAEGTGATQPLVWPKLATGGRPTVSANPEAEKQATISLQAWTLPAGTTFGNRTVQVWSCPSENNGQGAGFAWNAAGDGCTDASSGIGSAFNTANATSLVYNVPAGATGRYLVVSDLVLARFGTNTTGAAVRSAATLVGTTPVATPTPTPSASPSAEATPAPAPTAATTFRVAVTTKPAVVRGKKLKVVVSTSSAASVGEATVQLKKRPTTKAKAIRTLKAVDVVNGTGQSVTLIPKRFAKGNYYVVVTYRDDKTKRKTVGSSQVVVK